MSFLPLLCHDSILTLDSLHGIYAVPTHPHCSHVAPRSTHMKQICPGYWTVARLDRPATRPRALPARIWSTGSPSAQEPGI